MAKPKISLLMFLPPIAFAALAVLLVLGMRRDDPNALPSALAGGPAPALTLAPFANQPLVGDADLRTGQPVLVNYWASWCAPCRAEHPQLMQLKAEGVPIFGVNYKDEEPKALGFLAELGDPYTKSGADPKGRTAIDWGVYGSPETFVIDGQGNVVLRHAGPITPSLLESVIRPALQQAGD